MNATVFDPVDEHPETILFRIDTATGKTWRLQRSAKDLPQVQGKLLLEGWIEIDESWFELAKRHAN